jgi:hypothetical protein
MKQIRPILNNIPLVVAAGENGSHSSKSCFDSLAHEYDFLVGAVTHDYERYSWPNWGPVIEIFVPAFDIEIPLSHHDSRSRGKEFDQWILKYGASLGALRAYDEDFRKASVSDLQTWMKHYATKNIHTRMWDSPNLLLYTVLWGQ